ncbi:baseplate J/gp47 family protein [Acinetobacter sp. HY1485]|uniref:baseplate J/gp47 family protein n=1 Tax=Acinetobacter sp. HY1485 TaxID=2970918 RepID=UPI0022B99835|nr:baseplate J/gp47 family protein [Acinetobacter sp. HY1485]
MALTTIAPQLTTSGITAPTYYEIVEYLKEQYKAIYGDDAYLENDSMDGQWIGVIARAISDCSSVCIDLYSTFSPKTATGDALSRNVAINGIQRTLPTYSTVDLIIKGIAGTVITDGYAIDQNNKQWNLPSTVTISNQGYVTVTATAAQAGAILAQVNTVTKIGKPTRGWQSVNNQTTSTLGQALETDSELRQRQALSVALSSQSTLQSLESALLSLNGVYRCKIFENYTNTQDSNGLPAHTVCAIVQGGDSNEIATTINSKRSMGCGLFGNTTISTKNLYGIVEKISFYRPSIISIGYKIRLRAKSSYSTDINTQIKENLVDYTNQLEISDNIMLNKLYSVVNLFGAPNSYLYDVEAITILKNGVEVSGDCTLPFGSIANCIQEDIELEIENG